jgi:hypothetical protein
MARSYKRDKIGRFAGGTGGQISAGLAARKKGVTSSVSRDVLAGKKVSSSRKSYAKAQNSDAQQAAFKASGKGSKAARRAAGPKAGSGLMERLNAARAAGRAKGKAMAAKDAARNKALNKKAKAYGG